ncbi:MAG TPA: hypothetical protein VK961_26275 [Chthoniobacter sp.]|nr:hypothetical protein [Chthoniobacter sp.]
MRIQFHIPSVSKRLHGWKRVVRRATCILRGTLIVDLGRVTLELAN